MKMNARQTPHFHKLKNIIPEDELIGMIERDIIPHVEEFQEWRKAAFEKIPQALLCQVFDEAVEQNPITLHKFLGQWGNLSVESVSKICLIAKHIDPKGVFEFGSFNGMTTLQIALNTSYHCTSYTLDLPPDVDISGMSEIDTYMFRKHYKPNVPKRYIDTPVEHKIDQLYSDSRDFDFSKYYGKIDLVLIDGGHDYETKKSDTENALKLIGDQGVILWDNYDDVGCPYVTKYLSELLLPMHHLKGTNLVIYRKS